MTREPPWSEIPTREELRAEIKRLKAELRKAQSLITQYELLLIPEPKP